MHISAWLVPVVLVLATAGMLSWGAEASGSGAMGAPESLGPRQVFEENRASHLRGEDGVVVVTGWTRSENCNGTTSAGAARVTAACS